MFTCSNLLIIWSADDLFDKFYALRIIMIKFFGIISNARMNEWFLLYKCSFVLLICVLFNYLVCLFVWLFDHLEFCYQVGLSLKCMKYPTMTLDILSTTSRYNNNFLIFFCLRAVVASCLISRLFAGHWYRVSFTPLS